MTQTYSIARLEEWSDEQWDAIVEAVEDVVVSVAEEWGKE